MDEPRHSGFGEPETTLPTTLSLVPSPLRTAIERDDHFSGELQQLAAVCGGVPALETLTDDPTPDEPFDPSVIADADRALVEEIIATIELAGDRFLDDEHRTIARRLVAAAATHPTHPLRRKTAPGKLAAALTWIMLRGNMQLGPGKRLTGQFLWELFGVSNSADLGRSIAQKMRLLAPTGGRPYRSLPSKGIALGDVRLLHSHARSWLIQRRDETIEVANQIAADRERWSLVTVRDDGNVSIRCRDQRVLTAVKALDSNGRATVMVLLGNRIMDPDDVIAISVPDTHLLISALQHALDSPLIVTAS
jgi:hypothetical protein